MNNSELIFRSLSSILFFLNFISVIIIFSFEGIFLKSILNNLLIVEDNSFIENKIFYAAKEGSNIDYIHSAKSLQVAISLLNKTIYKLIILDLKLPDGNGLEILKILNG